MLCLVRPREQEWDAIVCICCVTQRRAEGSVLADDVLGGGAPVMMRAELEAGHWEHALSGAVSSCPFLPLSFAVPPFRSCQLCSLVCHRPSDGAKQLQRKTSKQQIERMFPSLS